MRGPASPETIERNAARERVLAREGFIPLERAAELAGRSRRAVNHWAVTGRVSWKKQGGKVYVLRADVKRVVKAIDGDAA